MCIYPRKENSVFVLRRGERQIYHGYRSIGKGVSRERQRLSVLSIRGKEKGLSILEKGNSYTLLVKIFIDFWFRLHIYAKYIQRTVDCKNDAHIGKKESGLIQRIDPNKNF